MSSIAERAKTSLEQIPRLTIASGKRQEDALAHHDLTRWPKPKNAFSNRNLLGQARIVEWISQEQPAFRSWCQEAFTQLGQRFSISRKVRFGRERTPRRYRAGQIELKVIGQVNA